MLHEILSDRRRAIGMSIDQLVEESGVPKGTVTKVLTGVSSNPALETIKAIAYALGLSLNDLEEDSRPKVSARAMAIAYAYDAMSDYGKSIIDCVVSNDKEWKVVKRIEIIEGAHDADVYARYNAELERAEMLAEQTEEKD